MPRNENEIQQPHIAPQGSLFPLYYFNKGDKQPEQQSKIKATKKDKK